jgi:hypothetical protein
MKKDIPSRAAQCVRGNRSAQAKVHEAILACVLELDGRLDAAPGREE